MVWTIDTDPAPLLLFHRAIASQMAALETAGLSTTYSCDRQGLPDLRLIHYNDVYHVEYAPLPRPSPRVILTDHQGRL